MGLPSLLWEAYTLRGVGGGGEDARHGQREVEDERTRLGVLGLQGDERTWLKQGAAPPGPGRGAVDTRHLIMHDHIHSDRGRKSTYRPTSLRRDIAIRQG